MAGWAEDNSIDSRDENGHFCGQSVKTGEMKILDDNKVGYCGPNCKHCTEFRVYAIQDGFYVCAADYDYERDDDYV